MKNYDLIVIGAGPGGYIAAIKAAQTGKKVALIEKGKLGGICLNVGCIPTKALIAGAEILHKIKKAKEFGITIDNYSIDYAFMKKRKDNIINNLRKSLEGLLLANKIEIIYGKATFEDQKVLKIDGDTPQTITSDKIIIAAGSDAADIKAFPCDHKLIRNSTSILDLEILPKKLVIIGGGYIGCEFASLFNELGVDVTILEALPSILYTSGKSISTTMTDSFIKKGIKILKNVKVENILKNENSITVKIKDHEDILAEMALVSVGRKAPVADLDLEKAKIHTNEHGYIDVNDKMETNIPGIYAIGDITGKIMLAHVSSHQGIVAGLNSCGEEHFMRYDAIPAVIFTEPEAASVGFTEEMAKEKNLNITVAKYPFKALGKSQTSSETFGFVEIIADKNTSQIYGATIVGNGAASLIAELTLAITNELTLESIFETVHAHPTEAEAVMEAAFLAYGTPLHYPPIRKI